MQGVFSTTLSEEYALAAQAFNLSPQTLFSVSLKSIDYIFADEEIKTHLRKVWAEFQQSPSLSLL
jgi:adenosine deaminase